MMVAADHANVNGKTNGLFFECVSGWAARWNRGELRIEDALFPRGEFTFKSPFLFCLLLGFVFSPNQDDRKVFNGVDTSYAPLHLIELVGVVTAQEFCQTDVFVLRKSSLQGSKHRGLNKALKKNQVVSTNIIEAKEITHLIHARVPEAILPVDVFGES